MNHQLVSVIIPAYNAGKFLIRCIQSILDQTYKNIEVIIVDDGSIDQTEKIANSFSEYAVKVITQVNKGAAAARNEGLKQAKGDFIQFLDADDFLSSDKIEKQVAILTENPTCISYCKTFAFYTDKPDDKILMMNEWYHNSSTIYNPKEFLIRLLGGYGGHYADMVQPNAWLCFRHIIDKAGGWNESLGKNPDDDGEFFARVILESGGVIYCSEGANFYQKYRSLGVSLSSMRNKTGLNSILSSIDLKAEYLFKSGSSKEAKIAIARQYTFFYYNCYPCFPKLWKEAKTKMLAYGGPSDTFVFGKNFLNNKILRTFIHWKLLKFLQEIKRGNLKYLFYD